MIEIDELIDYYRERQRDKLPELSPRRENIILSTITYLVAFKQVHEMLKNLGNAIQGIDLE